MEMTSQFIDSVQWSAAAFIAGVCLREYATDSLGKWLGRSGVLVSWCVIAAFGLHSVRQCSALTQLVESKNNAQEITNSPRVLAVASEYSATTKAGNKISATRFGGRPQRPMSSVYGRSGFDFSSDRHGTSDIGRTGVAMGRPDGHFGSMPYPESGVSF